MMVLVVVSELLCEKLWKKGALHYASLFIQYLLPLGYILAP
jgi:hypothetical protein